MKRFAVIGNPIDHSRSPEIYAPLFLKHGIDAEFLRIRVDIDMLPELKTITRGLDGFAVTMPLKRAVIPYLDRIDESATSCGSVNIVSTKNGVYTGYNTDGDGLLDALSESGFSPAGKTVFILGRGGAAASAYRALERNGADPVFLVRNLMGSTPYRERLFSPDPGRADLFINASPLGMKGGDDFMNFGFLDSIRPDTVFDMVYRLDDDTALIREARRRGVNTVDGSQMLLKQALRAFRIFTGLDA